MNPSAVLLTTALCLAAIACAGCRSPVTSKPAPKHDPVVLVKDGKPQATIVNMMPAGYGYRGLTSAIQNLQQHIEMATGAKLPISNKMVEGPAIVIGNCPPAADNGLVGDDMPVGGFAIRTAPNMVMIAGRDGEVAARTSSQGTRWGVLEFIERFVGVRWYWPGPTGLSVPKMKDLIVEPVWLEDAPVFTKRHIWPSGGVNVTRYTGQFHQRMRSADSWPVKLKVHAPHDWQELYAADRPEVFQLRADGQREFRMLCYSNDRTLATYLEEIAEHYDNGKQLGGGQIGIIGDTITVSPGDAAISCYCDQCKALWDPNGGQYSTASRIVATFVARLAGEVKKRWPGKTIIYLPYKNYTAPPEGIEFPDNVEVQICGMPGLAQYKEPAIAASEQAILDGWVKLSGRKAQNWHYSCWPENQTSAAYQYPHVIRDYYQRNRDKLVGSFVNGTKDHHARQNITLYCWMKLLWNPEFDVDAAIAEYCRRMYGPAAATMHELVTAQCDGWEKSLWPGGRLSPVGIYEHSYPRDMVVHMEELFARARKEAAGHEMILKRLDYIAPPLEAFFKESREYAEGTGKTALVARKVGENPKIDGKLDEALWEVAPPVSLIRATDRERKEPYYPTTLKAVWTFDGVTFGFHMAEPTPDRLTRDIKGKDDSIAWWNDNVEIFIDATGTLTGYHQFIINPNAAVYDSRGTDASWDCKGIQAAAHVGADFWSLEVFVPYAAFKEIATPATGITWFGNFTRHRVADRGLKPPKDPLPDSKREYQRLNTTYAGPSNNMMAFGPINFVE